MKEIFIDTAAYLRNPEDCTQMLEEKEWKDAKWRQTYIYKSDWQIYRRSIRPPL